MQLAKYVLAADRKLDLTDPSTAAKWLSEQTWWKGEKWTGWPNGEATTWTAWDRNGSTVYELPVGPTNKAWKLDTSIERYGTVPGTLEKAWACNIRALRSVAARLAGKPLDESVTDQSIADTILHDYLSRLQLQLVVSTYREPGGTIVLRASNLIGLMPCPTVSRHDSRFTIDRMDEDLSALRDFDVFWQCAFHSLIDNANTVQVCAKCGKKLAIRKSNSRMAQLKMCSTCRHQKHLNKMTADEQTKFWKRAKRKYRAAQRRRGLAKTRIRQTQRRKQRQP